MKNSLLPWIAAATLAVAGLIAHQLLRPSPAGHADDDAARADSGGTGASPGQDDAELRRMRAVLDALQSQVSTLDARAGARAPAALSKQPIRERVAADAQRHAAYVATLQASFKLEPVDPRWSTATTSRVWDAINASETMRGAARGVECRASSCRIEIRDDGSGRVGKDLPLWSQQFTDVLPRMVGQTVVDQNGQSAMVLYLMGPQPAPVPAPKG